MPMGITTKNTSTFTLCHHPEVICEPLGHCALPCCLAASVGDIRCWNTVSDFLPINCFDRATLPPTTSKESFNSSLVIFLEHGVVSRYILSRRTSHRLYTACASPSIYLYSMHPFQVQVHDLTNPLNPFHSLSMFQS